MAEKLETELVLGDGVSGPAKHAADALKKVEEASKKAQDSLTSKHADKFGKAFEKIGLAQERANIKSANKQTQLFADSWAKIGMAQAKAMSKEHHGESWLDKGAEEFGHKLRNAVAAAAIAEVIIGGIEKAVELLKEGVKLAFEEGGKEENLKLAYKLSLGPEAGKQSMEDSERFAGKTRFTAAEVQEMMLPLRRAGMSQAAARQAFATSGDIAAGSNGQVSEQQMIETFTKIWNKGGVSGKILQSAQINQPEFFKSLASTLKISKEEAKKRAEGGKIDPQILINAITEAVERRQGGIAGTGTKARSETMSTQLDKLQKLPGEFMRKLSESEAWPALSQKFSDVLKELDPKSENGKKIMGSLVESFGGLADVIKKAFTAENIKSFTEGIQNVLGVVKDLVPLLGDMVSLAGKAAALANGKFGAGDGDEVDHKIRQIEEDRQRNTSVYGGERANKFAQREFDRLKSPSAREELSNLGAKSGYAYGVVKPANRNGGKGTDNVVQINTTFNNHARMTDDEAKKHAKTIGDGIERAAQEAGAKK